MAKSPDEPWPFWESLLAKYNRVYNPEANAQALEKAAEHKNRIERFNSQFPDDSKAKR